MGGERAKGYMEWSPKPETLALLEDVRQVLAGFDEAPTARQVFYVLVGQFGFDKTEQAYSRLCEHLVKARRAQLISFNAIRDDKTDELGGDHGYSSVGEFMDGLREVGSQYGRYIREGQETRIELWCEARGMGPMLSRVAEKYGVRVFATGGFPGVTVTHAMARRVINSNQPTVFLHLGDYDPSGEAIYESMRDDVWSFVAGELGRPEANEKFTAHRVGLTEDQVVEHAIETAPPKKSDTRSRRWEDEGRVDSAQLEAVPVELLRQWARDAIEEHTDLDQVKAVAERGDSERERIEERIEAMFAEFDDEEDV